MISQNQEIEKRLQILEEDKIQILENENTNYGQEKKEESS